MHDWLDWLCGPHLTVAFGVCGPKFGVGIGGSKSKAETATLGINHSFTALTIVSKHILSFVAAPPQRTCYCGYCLSHLSSMPSLPAVFRIGHQCLFPKHLKDQHTLRNEANNEEEANLARTTSI
jgi:hypothetical protein